MHATGPRTPEGKAAASRNALRHGLTAARWPILPDEQDAYAAHHAALMAEAAPSGPIETALAEQAVLLLWRLRRCAHIEAGLLGWHQAEGENAHASRQLADAAPTLLDSLSAGDRMVRNQDAYAEAEAAKREADTRQRLGWPAIGYGFAQSAAAFAVLSRYEVGIEAALWRVLAQLRELQAARCETKPPDALNEAAAPA